MAPKCQAADVAELEVVDNKRVHRSTVANGELSI